MNVKLIHLPHPRQRIQRPDHLALRQPPLALVQPRCARGWHRLPAEVKEHIREIVDASP